MKKREILCTFIGTIVFSLGTWSIYNADSPLLPLLLFLGCSLITLPSKILQKTRLEIFSPPKYLPHIPIPHEPLFLAKLFVGLSYLARYGGILELCNTKIDKEYHNAVYRLGRDLIIDGYDPDYVKGFLENTMRLTRERVNDRISFLKQAGFSFTLIGLFAGLTGCAVYALRSLKGYPLSTEGMACLILMTVLCFMLGALFSLLLPCRIRNESRNIQRIQKQVATGLLSLQAGDDFCTLLLSQYAFLTVDELALLAEEPLPQELANEKTIGDYEKTRQSLRKELRDYNLL